MALIPTGAEVSAFFSYRRKDDRRITTTTVVNWAIISRIVVCILLALGDAVIPDWEPDDGVVRFQGFPKWATRWDSAQFLNLSKFDYRIPNDTAFFPLWPFLLRLCGSSPFLGSLISNACFILAARSMFLLSQTVLKNEELAAKSALIFCFNPASVFFSVPYTESLFAMLLFTGLVELERGRHAFAMVLFTLTTCVRSNGIVNAFYMPAIVIREAIGVEERVPPLFTLLRTVGYMICVISPFILFQVYVYYRFCPGEPWCSDDIPIPYAYVQKQWNNGLFRYWELKQIPNFLLAGPTLVVVSLGTCVWVRRQIEHRSVGKTLSEHEAPYVIQLAISALQVFLLNNVQIVTRYTAAACPAMMWFLARQDDEKVKYFCLGYIIVGAFMHANFLPWT